MPLRGTTLFVALVSARTENNDSADNFPFLVVNAVIGDVRVEVNVSNLILSIVVVMKARLKMKVTAAITPHTSMRVAMMTMIRKASCVHPSSARDPRRRWI